MPRALLESARFDAFRRQAFAERIAGIVSADAA